jgi:predicted acyl esterase
MRRGGIFAQWGTGPQRTVADDVAIEPVESDSDRHLLRQAAEEHQKSTHLLELWNGLPYRDSWSPLVGTRFWAESSVSSYAQELRQLGVPVYIMGGWYDELRDQGVIAWLNLPGSRLLLGPWKHCQNPGFELLQEIHRFFDTTLKGVDTGLVREARIHYYTMDGAGGGAWQSADSWPIPGGHPQRWFWFGQHSLGAKAPQRQVVGQFTVHGAVDCPQGGVGPFMQPCHIPGEGLSLTGDRLDRDVTLTGNPVVNIPLSADRPDVNVFAYLEDVGPDGNITVVTEGRLKASLAAEAAPPFKVPDTPWHRSYTEDAHSLQPGQSVTLHFDLMPTSYVLRKGHHIELTVMGADYRERGRDANIEGARINITSTPANPLWLDLPVLMPGA